MDNQVLVEAFKATIVPYIIQLTMILSYFGLAQSGWELIRKKNDFQQLFDKTKSIVIGYAIVKGAWVILSFIDAIVNNMMTKI